jgi:hypothetical protein
MSGFATIVFGNIASISKVELAGNWAKGLRVGHTPRVPQGRMKTYSYQDSIVFLLGLVPCNPTRTLPCPRRMLPRVRQAWEAIDREEQGPRSAPTSCFAPLRPTVSPTRAGHGAGSRGGMSGRGAEEGVGLPPLLDVGVEERERGSCRCSLTVERCPPPPSAPRAHRPTAPRDPRRCELLR